jgi:NAD(P)-dependent dehydrogenase (short-subunit alcohol dehydrogenase family)
MTIPRDYSPAPGLLKDRVIMVSGAGQGLGKAAALAFARHGATVVLHGREVAKLEALYDDIVTAGWSQPAIFTLDLALANDADFDGLANAVHKQLGRLDGILHSAVHFMPLSPLAIQTLDQWMALVRVNLVAPFALTRACLPLLKQAPDAAVIFTSETHALDPKAFWGGFAVAKSGLHTLTRIWADESAGTGIRFNTFVPGPVASPQRLQSHPGEGRSSLPAADALAPAYLYLMGPDSRKVSGEVLSWF